MARSTSKRSGTKRSSDSSSDFENTKKKPKGIWVFIAITALIIIAGAIYGSRGEKEQASIGEPELEKSTFESVIETGTTEEIRELYDNLPTAQNLPIPVRIENMTRQTQLAKRANQVAESTEDKNWAAYHYLIALKRLVVVSVGNQIESDALLKQLQEDSIRLKSSKNLRIAREAIESHLFAETIAYIQKDEPPKGLEELKAKFKAVFAEYPDDIEVAKSVQKASLVFRPFPGFQESELQILKLNAEHYLNRKDKELVELGESLMNEHMIFSYGLRDAENSFVTSPLEAVTLISETVDRILEDEKQLSAKAITRLLGACHVLELYDHFDVAIETGEKIATRIKSIQDVEKQKDIVLLWERLKTRCRAIGQKISFNEVTVDGTRIDSSKLPDQPLVICHLPGRVKQLPQVIENLKELKRRLLGQVEVVMLVVYGDEKQLKDIASLTSTEDQLILDTDQTTELFKQFPIRIRPGFLLVDKDRTMTKMIVDFRELSSSIDQLIYQTER